MKRKWLCAFACIMALGLTACGNTNSSVSKDNDAAKENESQDEVLVYKELQDPRGKTLTSTATGESNPKIVETLYETDDVVVADFVPTEMGYAVDPSGETDSTAGIQQALFDCYNAGGGTVFLPAGNYAISDTIYIPPYVSLRGDWQDPDEGKEYGTIISVWMEGRDEENAGAFEISGSAGIIGLTIYYPLQTLDCVVPYPYAIYVEETSNYHKLMTIKDITMINAYRGIGTTTATTHQQLQVDNIKGTFLNCAISSSNESDVGNMVNIVINNRYWKEASADCMNAVEGKLIDSYTRQYLTGISIGDLEWSTFSNIQIDQCAVGVHVRKGTRTEFAGNFYDTTITNCEKGMIFDGLDTRWGAVVAKSHVEGGIYNNVNGIVKLCDVEVEGGIFEVNEDTVHVDEDTDLSAYKVNYDAYYQKPKANMWIAKLPTGLETDATAQLQALLDEAGNAGGGIVYIPGGLYCFNKPLTVPANVELRGATSVPTREAEFLYGGEPSKGTLFFCYYGDDDSYGIDDQAFITLNGESAGLNGIRIIYPENSTRLENGYKTTYTVRGKAAKVYIVNCMIAASAYGVDFSNCDYHYIEGVMTTCYLNTFRVGGTGGVLTRCLQNGTVMAETAQSGLDRWVSGGHMAAWIFDYVTRSQCDVILVENAKDQLIYNAFVYGGKTIVHNVNSENTLAVNVGSDNIGSDASQIMQNGGSLSAINVMRYNGYSYELISGKLNLYNRIAINEVGERTLEKSK